MEVKAKNTGKIEELEIRGNNGIEWTGDLLGNAGLVRNKEGLYQIDEEDFLWWAEYIKKYKSDEEE